MFDVFGFIFRAAVYGQVFLWWWLFDQEELADTISEDAVKALFCFACLIVLGAVICFNFQVSQYTPYIILNYIALYAVAFDVYLTRYNWVRALSLMGLTVFLNSYYWEIVLHVAEINAVRGFTPSMILQMVHLLPVWFFISRYEFNKTESLDALTKGVWVSFGVAYVAIKFLSFSPMALNLIPFGYREPLKLLLYTVNRFACLLILIAVILSGKLKEIKK